MAKFKSFRIQSLTPENMLEPEQVQMVLLHIHISQKVS